MQNILQYKITLLSLHGKQSPSYLKIIKRAFARFMKNQRAENFSGLGTIKTEHTKQLKNSVYAKQKDLSI